MGETETDCTSVVQYDGMSFLDYKKKHQTLPDTHKYQEYQLRERGLQRDESFSVNDDCLEVINYKAEQRYEQQICTYNIFTQLIHFSELNVLFCQTTKSFCILSFVLILQLNLEFEK